MPIDLPRIFSPFTDQETARCGEHARVTRRSWWALRYSWLDDWVHEWDPDPESPNGHRDWPLQIKRGRQAVRLYCPNGRFAQLGDTHDATGKLFQLKAGNRHVAIGAGIGTIVTREILAQIVGMVHGLNGECTLYAWEPLLPPDIPVDAPKCPNEQEWIAKSAEPGLYEQAYAQWEKDLRDYEHTRQFKQFQKAYSQWERNARGRLVGPIEDNVYDLKYQGIGAVAAEYLGIEDGEGK